MRATRSVRGLAAGMRCSIMERSATTATPQHRTAAALAVKWSAAGIASCRATRPAMTATRTTTTPAPRVASHQCGDGFIQIALGEFCDDQNLISGDGCSAVCVTEICGDGKLDEGERCDDGNISSEDGCSDLCQAEFTGGSCAVGNAGRVWWVFFWFGAVLILIKTRARRGATRSW